MTSRCVESASVETADRNHRRYVFGNRQDMRSRDESGGHAEIPADNSDSGKQNAAGNFSKRKADCGNALRRRYLNRDTLVAIPGRAEQFVVDQPEIVRASAPARV